MNSHIDPDDFRQAALRRKFDDLVRLAPHAPSKECMDWFQILALNDDHHCARALLPYLDYESEQAQDIFYLLTLNCKTDMVLGMLDHFTPTPMAHSILQDAARKNDLRLMKAVLPLTDLDESGLLLTMVVAAQYGHLAMVQFLDPQQISRPEKILSVVCLSSSDNIEEVANIFYDLCSREQVQNVIAQTHSHFTHSKGFVHINSRLTNDVIREALIEHTPQSNAPHRTLKL